MWKIKKKLARMRRKIKNTYVNIFYSITCFMEDTKVKMWGKNNMRMKKKLKVKKHIIKFKLMKYIRITCFCFVWYPLVHFYILLFRFFRSKILIVSLLIFINEIIQIHYIFLSFFSFHHISLFWNEVIYMLY